MKIIQITTGQYGYDNEVANEIFGLSDEGKLYRWGEDSDILQHGWILMEDELN